MPGRPGPNRAALCLASSWAQSRILERKAKARAIALENVGLHARLRVQAARLRTGAASAIPGAVCSQALHSFGHRFRQGAYRVARRSGARWPTGSATSSGIVYVNEAVRQFGMEIAKLEEALRALGQCPRFLRPRLLQVPARAIQSAQHPREIAPMTSAPPADCGGSGQSARRGTPRTAPPIRKHGREISKPSAGRGNPNRGAAETASARGKPD